MYVPLLLWLIAIQDLGPKAEDVAVTLNGFSQIVNADLARDLGPDVVKMLTHSRAHIRKRAIVALYGVLTKHPELTSTALPRLRERLEDNDPGNCLLVVMMQRPRSCILRRCGCRDQCPLRTRTTEPQGLSTPCPPIISSTDKLLE